MGRGRGKREYIKKKWERRVKKGRQKGKQTGTRRE